MKLDVITRLQKRRETISFTISFMKLIWFINIFCQACSYLFAEVNETMLHGIIMMILSSLMIHLLQKEVLGYNTAMFLSLATDAVCFDVAYNRFPEHSYVFIMIGHQLFIQSCIFNYYSQPLGYFIIIARTSAWFFLTGKKWSPSTPEPLEVSSAFIGLIISQIFLSYTLDKRTTQEIQSKVSLESQLNYFKFILQEISYGILVLDKNLSVKFRNKAYDDLFTTQDFLEIYQKEKNYLKDLKDFISSSKTQLHVGKFLVKEMKVTCNGTKGLFEGEKFAILTFNRILNWQHEDELGLASMLQEMSHDLKTPLNSIINEQRSVIEAEGVKGPLKLGLKRSYFTSCVLLSFIQDIIDYSNLNSDLMIINPTFFDISGLLKECSKWLKHAFQRNCDFHISSSVSKLVYSDKAKLRQVLISVFYALYNSCPSGTISLNLEKNTESLLFQFKATSSNSLKLISSAFNTIKFRITQEIAAKLIGNPLKVSHFLEKNEVCIDFEVKTEFHIDGPLVEDHFESSDMEMGSVITDFIDILVVDDMDINCEILKRMVMSLEEHCKCPNYHKKKFTVHSANSGKDAIQLVQLMNQEKRGYRIIFMDCQMPELDGWETSQILNDLFKEKAIYSLPYIIAYSAYDLGNDKFRYLKVGMSDHLAKPCLREELCLMINEWISKPIRRCKV
jgi:CheY-like chemotaxis protein